LISMVRSTCQRVACSAAVAAASASGINFTRSRQNWRGRPPIHDAFATQAAQCCVGERRKGVKASQNNYQMVRTGSRIGQRETDGVLCRDQFILKNPKNVRQDYSFKETLGEGGYSTVHRAVHKRTGIVRAVKKIDTRKTDRQCFESEVRSLIILDHPHIVKVIEYFEDKSHYYLVTEFCVSVDLFDYVECCGGVPEKEAALLFRQCLLAVAGCHWSGIIHRDLKPENFILMKKDHSIKLIDFGLSTSGDDGLSRTLGTAIYMAPEAFTEDSWHAAEPGEIWSLGCILFVMLTTEACPSGDEVRMDAGLIDKHCSKSDRFQNLSWEARDLIERMLRVDPEQRPSIEEALEHPFLASCAGSALRQRHFARSCMQLPWKMKAFAEAPLLRRIATQCIVHLAASSALQDSLAQEVEKARHVFRALDANGSGIVSEDCLRERLVGEGASLPDDFSETFAQCTCSTLGHESATQHLEYTVFVACEMMDSVWPDLLYRETFNILDRSHSGVLEVEDLVTLACNLSQEQASATTASDLFLGASTAISEVDPDGSGYIRYDRFMEIMRPAQGTSIHRQWVLAPNFLRFD